MTCAAGETVSTHNMNRFSSKENVRRVEFGDGDWAEIPAVLTTEEAEAIRAEKNNAASLKKLVLRWNLEDAPGHVAEVTEENLRKLDVRVELKLVGEIVGLMALPKETSPASEEKSVTAGPATN